MDAVHGMPDAHRANHHDVLAVPNQIASYIRHRQSTGGAIKFGEQQTRNAGQVRQQLLRAARHFYLMQDWF